VTEVWELSATEALARMRAKDLSPVELLASVQARAVDVEPTVNALTEVREEAALIAAAESAERYARGEDIRPLEGLPVALKEEVPVEGWRMRYGSLAVDEIAHETAPIAERIFAAGAVVHARTTTPEFSCTGYTHSKLWGVTRNPWNTDYTTCGSSAGSAAMVAAGVVPIVTPVGAIPDVVTEGEHGVFVAPRDAEAIAQAIARLAADRAALARMSAAGRACIAAGYSLERVSRDFSQLYWDLCAARTPRTAT